MEIITRCPECGASWSTPDECTAYFHQMLFWEWDEQLFDVHHLMVLCYHLQHPSLYSAEALARAKRILAQYLDEGLTPQVVRSRSSRSLDSGERGYPVRGTHESAGRYEKPVRWSMRAADVVGAGVENYYASVRQWAAATLNALRSSGNMD